VACERGGLEGIVSKRADAPYVPGDRGLWHKTKCLNTDEFIVVGWSEPEGSRPYFGSLLLGYYDDAGRLHYAGRAGTGISDAESRTSMAPAAAARGQKDAVSPSPRKTSHFGSPLELSRVHWVRPELVVQVKYVAWADQGFMRQVIYQGVRERHASA